jgi:hypothetical protein
MTNKLFMMLAAGAIGLAAPAVAASFAEIDGNGDGALSQDEFFAAYPDVSADVWTTTDANADGLVSEDELQAAIEGGSLPAE